MIADIYGKLSRSGSNLSEKLEDKLTGDIFGAVRYLPADKLLLPFLRKAYWLDPDNHDRKLLELEFSTEPEIAFWPHHYIGIEPDVEITGDRLHQKIKILIEVKYKSGLSSDDDCSQNVSALESNNQLIRQAKALADTVKTERKILIFLTEDGSYPRNVLDRVSRILRTEPKLSEIELFWLSWHDISEVLSFMRCCILSVFERRISDDLYRYCDRKQFRRYDYRFGKRHSSWSFKLTFDKKRTSQARPFDAGFLRHPSVHTNWRFDHE